MTVEHITLENILQKIKPINDEWIKKAKERTSQLVMPPRALGRLHDISERICGIQKTLDINVDNKAFVVMAGDHGVVDEGISAFPQEVTNEMIKTFIKGGAGINALARNVGAEVWVVDIGSAKELDKAFLDKSSRLLIRKINKGTANLSKEPAMTREEAKKSVLIGFQIAVDLFQKGVNLLGTGDMGIGNTTPSAAIGAVITGKTVDEMTGFGTGIDGRALIRKKDAIRRGIQINQPDKKDGIDVLSKVGGFEIGGIAGCILAGAYCNRPVIVDGFISTAGALIAHALCPKAIDYCFAGHCSEEPGHKIMLKYLGLDPILNLGMRLGEGTGAALSMGIIQGAVKMFREMLTFDEANVSK